MSSMESFPPGRSDPPSASQQQVASGVMVVVAALAALALVAVAAWAIWWGGAERQIETSQMIPAGAKAVSVSLDMPHFPFALRRVSATAPGQPIRVFENGKPMRWLNASAPVLDGPGGTYTVVEGKIILAADGNRDPRSAGPFSYRLELELHPATIVAFGIPIVLLAGLKAEKRRPRFAVRSLARIGLMLLQEGFPVLAVAGILIALGWGGFHLLDQADQKRMMLTDTSSIIVYEQMVRTTATGDRDVVFVGDSSCLMGIDFAKLDRLYGGHTASFCSIAYLGPRGYAKLLNRYFAQGHSASAIVIALHPVQFKRDPGWNKWISFVDNDGPARDRRKWWLALRTIETNALGKVVYSPLSGTWGNFYGSPASLRNMVRDTGGAIDAGTGLVDIEALRTLAQPVQHAKEPFDYTPNDEFYSALDELADTLRRFNTEKVYLMITPIYESVFFGTAPEGFRQIRNDIAHRLGIPVNNILDLPPAMHNGAHATLTHLNAYGRDMYTDLVAAELSCRIPHASANGNR